MRLNKNTRSLRLERFSLFRPEEINIIPEARSYNMLALPAPCENLGCKWAKSTSPGRKQSSSVLLHLRRLVSESSTTHRHPHIRAVWLHLPVGRWRVEHSCVVYSKRATWQGRAENGVETVEKESRSDKATSHHSDPADHP